METENEGDVSKVMHVIMTPPVGPDEKDLNPWFQKLPPEIRVYVLRMLPTQDLLNCRMVNHQWKCETNSVLRSRKVFAILKRPCKDLIRPDLDLMKFNFEVIKGLKLIRGVGCCIGSNFTGEGRSADSYVSKHLATAVPWKNICIDGFWDWEDPCPAPKVVHKILSKVGGSLEGISLVTRQALHVFDDFLLSVKDKKKVTFPKLRTLKMPPGEVSFTDPEFPSLLLPAAPNLSEIECKDAYEWDWGENFKTLARKFSSIGYWRSGSLGNLQKLVRCEPRSVKILNLGCACKERDLKDCFIRLVHWNRNSLQELNVCAYEIAALLQTLGPHSPVLPTVEKLNLELPESGLCSGLLCSINFTQSFPALTEIHVRGLCQREEDHLGNEEEERGGLDNRIIPSAAQSLIYYDHCDQHQPLTFRLLGQVFALVTTMHLKWELGSFGLSEIFVAENFPRLELLTLQFEMSPLAPAPGFVDAVLCGLSPQEAELLQDLSKSESLPLEELSLAPIRPALSNAKRLKQLKIDIKNLSRIAVRQMSLVSRILALSRLPELRVPLCTKFEHFKVLRRVRPSITDAEMVGLDKN